MNDPISEVSRYLLETNADCLCRSGNRFASCCSTRLPGFKIGRSVRVHHEARDWLAALAVARADVCQYSIWHLAHTVPALQRRPELAEAPGKNLLKIDIAALSDYVESLRYYHSKAQIDEAYHIVLERLASNIDHPMWRRRILYLQCIERLGNRRDKTAGQQEFEKLGSMENETDPEILQLYLDLFGEQLGFTERMKVIDQVIVHSAQAVDRLHYSCLRGVTYLMIGDKDAASREVVDAIDKFREEAPEKTRSLYAKSRYAMALELGGCINGDYAMLDEAIPRLDELAGGDDWTPSGNAQIYRQLGDVYRYKAAWREAKEAFQKAVAIEQEAIFDVYIAQSALYLDGPEQACFNIKNVDASRLNPSEYLDYVFVLAQISVESGDKELLKLAESLLRNLRIAEPYYQQQCATLLLSVIDTKQSGPSEQRTLGVRRQTRGILTLLLRYIKLEPNVMGIGVNLGRVIEDLANRDTR